jgi:hypothetical protein
MPTFDLRAIEQQIRASLEAADVQRSDAVRAGALDLPFAMAMKQFDEARVQFLLAGLTLENDGVQREVALSAAGQAIGSMWGNALQYALGARERAVLNGWVTTALSDNIKPEAAAKAVDAAIKPIEPAPEPIELETVEPEGSA